MIDSNRQPDFPTNRGRSEKNGQVKTSATTILHDLKL